MFVMEGTEGIAVAPEEAVAGLMGQWYSLQAGKVFLVGLEWHAGSSAANGLR